MSVKIIIADDHNVVLVGMSIMISDGIPKSEVDSVQSYPELLEVLSQTEYDVVLLDINMPGTKNLKMIDEIKKLSPNIKIIVFTSHDENVGVQYIKAGANSYISKLSSENDILETIKLVIEKGTYYSQELAQVAFKELNKHKVEHVDPSSLLSEREIEIFNLLLNGRGNQEIATKLQIHMSTVSTYKKRLFEKLNIRNLTELIKVYHK